MPRREFYVYMMASNNRRALYIGVTNNLLRRILEHRNGTTYGFTKKYHCVNLVFFQGTSYAIEAIQAEKRYKKWRREKKNALVAGMNPEWKDLSHDFGL